MPRLAVRTEEAMERALAALTVGGRTRTEAVRHALLRTCREELTDRVKTDADQLADDRAEMPAIQRYMGIAG